MGFVIICRTSFVERWNIKEHDKSKKESATMSDDGTYRGNGPSDVNEGNEGPSNPYGYDEDVDVSEGEV